MKKTILITGGAGFIGSHTADALAVKGFRGGSGWRAGVIRTVAALVPDAVLSAALRALRRRLVMRKYAPA